MKKYIRTYVSVDCVVFGFNDNQLHILLVEPNPDNKESLVNLKLPGSLIYSDEDLDDAAHRVLHELTGIKKLALRQFRCFAAPDRAADMNDIKWLDKAYQPNINRLITVAYLSLCKIGRKPDNAPKNINTRWLPLNQIPIMPFDHNNIVKESLVEVRRWIENDPSIVFEILPKKFTIRQLHGLYESAYNKTIDIRNFHKKVALMTYIVPLDEKQKDVSHRAARYYKFERKAYNRSVTNM